MNYEFPITKTTNPKQKPDPKGLRFGTEFTDHMFVMDYNPEDGWNNGRIVPYGPIELDPCCSGAPLWSGDVRRTQGLQDARRPRAVQTIYERSAY